MPDESREAAVAAAMQQLLDIRSSIDNIDAALIHLLAERFKFTQHVGRLKARYGLPPSDPNRERQQLARLRELAIAARLDPAFAEKWFNFVVAEVIQHHEEIAEELAGELDGAPHAPAGGEAGPDDGTLRPGEAGPAAR